MRLHISLDPELPKSVLSDKDSHAPALLPKTIERAHPGLSNLTEQAFQNRLEDTLYKNSNLQTCPLEVGNATSVLPSLLPCRFQQCTKLCLCLVYLTHPPPTEYQARALSCIAATARSPIIPAISMPRKDIIGLGAVSYAV